MPTPAALPPLSLNLGEGRLYQVVYGPLSELGVALSAAGLRPGRSLLVTDDHVAASYADKAEATLRAAGWTPLRHTIPPGEASKSPAALQALYDAALAWGIDRKTPVVALGGGVVGDLAGYAAATLLRGLPLVQVPTSLIAQVDSALGGKTGINHAAGKNLIGAFHQPALVYTDPEVLHTLPFREWTSGLAEAVKHALIADPAFIDWQAEHLDALLSRDRALVPAFVRRAAAIKAEVVVADEREQGRRALLNFGHTFGHAIEKVAGYGVFTHGEAVALGMRAALTLSAALHPDTDFAVARRLLDRLPVPAGVAALDREALMAAMQADKKTEAGRLRLVVLRAPGVGYVTDEATDAAVRAAWRALQAEDPTASDRANP